MPTISMTVRGSDQLRRNLQRLQGAQRLQAQADGLEEGARVIETWAKVYAPIDTSYLVNSIQIDEPVTPTQAVVSVGADYAIHQEYGTYKMAAHPFMRPAIDEHEQEIIAAVEAKIAAFVNGVAG